MLCHQLQPATYKAGFLRYMDSTHNKQGLTTAQAETLLAKHGQNEITHTSRFTLLSAFISQFNNFLTILLILAGIVSFVLGERVDSFFIFLIVILNAAFGLYQEAKAEKSLETLKKLTVSLVRVVRDGKQQEIDSRLLVPGDVVYIEEGSKVPADGIVVESMHLEVNEASLTGESLPVEKNAKEEDKRELFMGTVIAKGRGYMLVAATGDETRFGKIAKTLATIEKVKTPLQKKLEVLTKQIGLIGILASTIVFALSFVKDKTMLESFIFGVSLAVAAVPEGLPAVMTITLAIGVEKMAKKKAIIRKLNSIEALGSVTLVATDKTGTLTTNKMRVMNIWIDGTVYDRDKPPSLDNQTYATLLLNATVCSTASIVTNEQTGDYDVVGDTTEGAAILLAQEAGISADQSRQEWEITDELAFDPVTKRMSVVAKKGKQHLVFTKGAPESILSITDTIRVGNKEVPFTDAKKKEIESQFQKFAKNGLRMIAFSYKKKDGKSPEQKQTFLGFVGIADPVRPEVVDAVKRAKRAGIRVIMITGDNELTAEAVGRETGIMKDGDNVMTGKQLDTLGDEELLPHLAKTTVFARTTPDHKHRLVKLYQSKGDVVSVTGDGVNDALALKQADVGVAMGITGTDVAKETADMIVTDDNFASLINAVEYGRNIFNQIKNAITYLLACNLGEVVFVITAVVFNFPVITALQILYINIVTDGIPAISLAFAPNDRNIMQEKPKKTTSILGKKEYTYIAIVGVLTALLAIVSILPYADRAIAITVHFTVIIMVQQYVLLDIWVGHRPILPNLTQTKHGIFLVAFLMPFILHPVIVYHPFFNRILDTVPLTLGQFGFASAVSLLIIVFLEVIKIKNARLIR